MSQTITQGALSYVPTQDQTGITNGLDSLIDQLGPNWEIVSYQTDRQELLLFNNTNLQSSITELREFLQVLQATTHKSYVALLNDASQYVLITVRG